MRMSLRRPGSVNPKTQEHDSTTEFDQITYHYLIEYNRLVNDGPYVLHFINQRVKFKTVRIEGESWKALQPAEMLILAISILDAEAIDLFNASGGLH